MKILVLSDSHNDLTFARRCICKICPDMILHLGDYYEDGEVLRMENPQIPFYQVPGNCDRFRCPPTIPGILTPTVGNVRLYITHGHLHRVKWSLKSLLREAEKIRADAVLYGHTHEPDCHQESDGVWVLNPGSCAEAGSSAGLLEIQNGKITSCRLIGQEELENEA